MAITTKLEATPRTKLQINTIKLYLFCWIVKGKKRHPIMFIVFEKQSTKRGKKSSRMGMAWNNNFLALHQWQRNKINDIFWSLAPSNTRLVPPWYYKYWLGNEWRRMPMACLCLLTGILWQGDNFAHDAANFPRWHVWYYNFDPNFDTNYTLMTCTLMLTIRYR